MCIKRYQDLGTQVEHEYLSGERIDQLSTPPDQDTTQTVVTVATSTTPYEHTTLSTLLEMNTRLKQMPVSGDTPCPT